MGWKLRCFGYRSEKAETWHPVQTELVFFPVMDDVSSPVVDYPREWPSASPVVSRYPEMKKRPLHAYLEGRRFLEIRRKVDAITDPVQKLLRIGGERYVVRIRAPMPLEELWYGVPPEPQPRE